MSRFIDAFLRRPAPIEIEQKSLPPESASPVEIPIFDSDAEAEVLPEVSATESKPVVQYGSAFTTAYTVDLMKKNLRAGKTVRFPSVGVELTADNLRPEDR